MDKRVKPLVLLLIGVVILLTASVATAADSLALKDDRVLAGTFKGATDDTIKFEVKGKIQRIALKDAVSLTFAPRKAQPAVQQQAAAAEAGEEASGPITVPAGTRMMLKLSSDVSTASHKAGSKVTAVLETDLAVEGAVVAPKGTTVYGEVVESRGGRRIGKQVLAMVFTDINMNNQLIPIVTDQVGAEGGRGGALRKVGAGALIGSGIDGSKGAGTGAAIAGGLALLGPGNHIKIPEGTLAEVQLKEPLTVQK